MSRIERYFEDITPMQTAEQIAQGVMRKAESGAKKRSFRPLVAVAAAVAVTAAGVTTAAATGFLNINEIFGGRISAQDEMLAGELVIAAEDFTWSVSDEDYMIELKGLTGSKSDMLLMYEIKRTDGRPVTDYMTNIPEDGLLTSFVNNGFEDEKIFTAAMDYNQYTVNEQGNIEVFNRLITDGDLVGWHYSVDGNNLYPAQQLLDLQQDEHFIMWTVESDEIPMGFYTHQSIEDAIPAIALNDERIIGLELEWSIDFTYSPSGTSALSKNITAEDMAVSVNRQNTFTGDTETLECTITKNHFSCVGGWLELEYYNEPDVGDLGTVNEVYLITEDGNQIPCSFVSYGYHTLYVDGTVTTIDAEIRYSENINEPITAIDISEITAISINGEIFPLA